MPMISNTSLHSAIMPAHQLQAHVQSAMHLPLSLCAAAAGSAQLGTQAWTPHRKATQRKLLGCCLRTVSRQSAR
jgi:hypothetical protein